MIWKTDKFIIAIVLAVLAAYLFPQGGSGNAKAFLDTVSSIGISFIFFFYGIKLGPEKLRLGVRNWKLHLLIQLATFLLFPLLVIGFYPIFQNESNENLWLAFLFLGAMPSTVSSSVVMVSLARGNVPAAIFNASISGLIGILVTPLWIGLFMKNHSAGFDLGSIYVKLLTEILIPIVLGLCLQKWLGRIALRYNQQLNTFDKSVIVLIIYKSFAESFQKKIFESVNFSDLAWITISVILLFAVVYFFTGFISRILRFNREDRITAQFCGTKKSLVHGTVFSKILFPATFPVGMVLLPLLVFHAIQIFIVGIIASRKSKEINS
ncbi:MAG: bile acid:sodium symporter family protein [Moheibacter sp.]